MNVDLTAEEINILTQLLETTNLSMNRQQMTVYLALSNSIISKFNRPEETPNEPIAA